MFLPSIMRGLGKVAGRHVGYPEPVQKQHADALYIRQEPNLSQVYKSHSSEAVNPKAVLPVCFIHLYASAKCCFHRSTCCYVTYTCLGAAVLHIPKYLSSGGGFPASPQITAKRIQDLCELQIT